MADYLERLKAKTVRGRKVSTKHRKNVERHLNRVVTDCGFKLLGDITRSGMEKWMNRQEADGMGARTRNMHRSLDLTMNIYTDPVLLDIGVAVESLPAFSADKPATLAASKV